MDRIDRSLDDIIAAQKGKKKPDVKKAPRLARVPSKGRVSKPFTRGHAVTAREAAIFSETYRAMNAPVKEIFTSQYIPNYGSIKLVAHNPNASRDEADRTSPVSKISRSPSVRMSTGPTSSHGSSRSASDISRSLSSSRQGDFYRPSPSNRENNRSRETERSMRYKEEHGGNMRRPSDASHSRRRSESSSSRPVSGHENRNSMSNGNSRAPSQRIESKAPASPVTIKLEDTTDEMEIDEGPVKAGRMSPQEEFTIRGEGGPATVEIDNLDPETTTEDVKVVCSRYGEIRSCICSNGSAQVTYARKAAAVAALECLNGKKADNDRILKVRMRKTAIIHHNPIVGVTHIPTPIAGPMRLISKAVQGSISNVGAIYADQLATAQAILAAQQQRLEQLHQEERRLAANRQQNVE
ncbi:hypothetical protein EMPS_10513 [Entomortierella parvispora]|uniref:RRM domain-containing protein n=1 Tax=Entomortierella parvispora TaxID=205924 RepID=A0A9P3HJZ4_9FUNG|nr:hypothetical protein EMPS_10513 [Entomortierella parvispora]